jgi:hypothetical protein
MKKQLIFDGKVYDLVAVEPEPEPEWNPRKGELCEFSDDPSFPVSRTRTGKYSGVSGSKNFPFRENETNWAFCRPLQDPDLIQMIPWEGGECPVSKDAEVLVRFRNGATANCTASSFSWSHTNNPRDIVKYAVLK